MFLSLLFLSGDLNYSKKQVNINFHIEFNSFLELASFSSLFSGNLLDLKCS